MGRGGVLRLILGLLVAGGFLWLIAGQVDMAELGAILAEARLPFVALGVVCFLAGYACRIARWRAMLRPENPRLTFRACAGPFMASMAVNNVLPFRAGDAMRAFAFSRRLGVPGGRVLASMLIERLLDLATVLLALALALAVYDIGSAAIFGPGASVSLLGIAGLVLVLLVFPGTLAPLARLCVAILARLSTRAAATAEAGRQTLFGALRSLSRGRGMAGLIAWSVAAWTLEGGVFLCAALALPAITDPLVALPALPAGTLATLIPGTPGHLGTFDFFATAAMTAQGVRPEAAAGVALLTHLMLWLPPTIIGGIAALRLSLSRTTGRSAPA